MSGVIAERPHENQTYFLVSPFPMEGEGIASVIMQAAEVHRLRFNKALNGRPLGVPVKIMIGRAGSDLSLHRRRRRSIQRSVEPSYRIRDNDRVLIHPARTRLPVTFITGSEYHERYLPCLWTMFGSWRWLR